MYMLSYMYCTQTDSQYIHVHVHILCKFLTLHSKQVGVVWILWALLWPLPLCLGEEEILHGLKELGRQRHLPQGWNEN